MCIRLKTKSGLAVHLIKLREKSLLLLQEESNSKVELKTIVKTIAAATAVVTIEFTTNVQQNYTTRPSRAVFSWPQIIIHSSKIIELAADKFEKTGKGITYKDLMDAGIVIHKRHAQDILKYHLRKWDIFTLKDKRPQQYYPTNIKSKVIEKITKNTPIDPKG